MEALLKLEANEFSSVIIEKIKLLIPTNDCTITISISNDTKSNF